MIDISHHSTVRHFPEGIGVRIYRYFLNLFLPGYTRWEVTDFSKPLNGVGSHLWPE